MRTAHWWLAVLLLSSMLAGVSDASSVVGPNVTLVGTDAAPGQRNLLQIDPLTGSSQVIGPLGAEIAGLTWDPNHNILYGCSTSRLYRINPETGAAEEVGPFGFELLHTIEYDPAHNILYGLKSAVAPYGLCTIDVNSGQAALVATFSATSLNGVALDPASGTMYASDIAANRLLSVDLQTGALSVVGNFNAGVQVGVGLAYDPAHGLLATDNRSNELFPQDLYLVDKSTGAATLVGQIEPRGNMLSLAFIPEPGVPTACLLAGLGVLRRPRRSRK